MTLPTQHPDALRLADVLEKMPGYDWNKTYCEAAFQLRHIQRQNECLTAENEALRKNLAPLTDAEKHAMWVMTAIDQCSHEQCYLRGIKDSEAVYGIV